VTFIHIHPAEVEFHLVKEFLAAQHWNYLVGLDRGDREAESRTKIAYGVRGYPTMIIVDKQGRVAFNSDARSEEEKTAAMKATAAEIGLPWPPEKDADHDELLRRLQRFHEHWMSKEIERALARE